MGRPGRLGLRSGILGSSGQLSLDNYNASIISKELANMMRNVVDGSDSTNKPPHNKKEKIKSPIFDSKGHA